MEPTDPSLNKYSSHYSTCVQQAIATSDVGTTIAMMEEVLNADGSRSIVAGVIGMNNYNS